MNWSNVWLILQREVRDQLRDRRTLFMIAVLPLLLYPLLGMSFFQVAQFMREHPLRVEVLGAEGLLEEEKLPPLLDHSEEQFAGELFTDPSRARLLELEFADPQATSDPETTEAGIAAARERLQQGECQLVILFPPDFADRLAELHRQLESAAERESKSRPPTIPRPRIFHNSANEKSQIAYARVQGVLSRWTDLVREEHFEVSKVPQLAARPVDFETSDVADAGHRDAAMWSKILPFVLLIWALTGAFYPAIDLCAGEKERGTLETLLSSPAGRNEIVWGKLLTVMLFSAATSALNLASMGITGLFVIGQLNELTVAAGTDQALGVPPLMSLIWLLIALPPISALFSALCLALAAFARSTKEGQYYLMPLVLVTMPLTILPMAPGVELTLGNSLIPVTGVVLLLRAMLEGNYLQALPYVIPVTAVTLLGCLLAVRWAVHQFNRESVLFRESERLDLGLWLRHLVRDRGPTPTIAEGVACFLLILLVQFFMNFSLSAPREGNFGDFVQVVFISQVVVIALPVLLMTLLLTRRPAQTLLLDRMPHLLAVPVAILLAAAIHPLAHSLQAVVQRLYPPSEQLIEMNQLVMSLLNAAPSLWMVIALLAVLPAVCEEIAFRGFILSALRHLGHKWWAIALSALFFGVTHGVLQQSLMAAGVGAIIGYVAIQTGSLIPCICFHATHNALLLATTRFEVTAESLRRFPGLEWFVQPLEAGGYHYGVGALLAGAGLTGYLLHWLHRLPYQKTAEERLQEALDHQETPQLAIAEG